MAGATARRSVWKYKDANGVVHYTNVRPVSGPSQLLFSYIEIKASGQMWRQVFTATDGTEVFVHTESVTRVGRSASGWVLIQYATPQQIQQGLVQSQAEKWSVDCEAQRASQTDVVSYAGPFGSGGVVQSWGGSTNAWAAVPGSSGDAAIRTICLGPSKGASVE